MIDTILTRRAQIQNGYFQSGSGPTEILIVGSCRTIAFLNYLIRWNDGEGKNQFTIRRIDPCDWHFNEQGEMIDIRPALATAETDPRILSVLKSSTIFLHEHFANYDIFNTDRSAERHIYQLGVNAATDISIPNWHDTFVLYNDFMDFNAMTPDWTEKGEAAIQKVCDLCQLTSFPEMGDYIRDNWRKIRFFWRPNHTSKHFTLKIFELMNEKFLHLPLSDEFWNGARQEDLFQFPNTAVTDHDREAYGLTWI